MPALAGTIVYSFQTIINPGDPAFDKLLGINNASTIAGYFGDGTVVPNNGFTLVLPNNFTPENFPGSAQTQVIGINNLGNTDGFYIDAAGVTHGFTDTGGTFMTVDDPTSVLTKLLGLNASGEAAGYGQNAAGTQFPFTVQGNTFTGLDSLLPTNTSAQATDVNNAGAVSGFYVDATGTHGFLLQGTTATTLNFPGATLTQALGVNNNGEVVGVYSAAGFMHGFIYDVSTPAYQSIDDPQGIGTTTVNGINDQARLVGFYLDRAGNTDGFVATPVATPVPEPSTLLLLGTGLAGLIAALRKPTR
jgi:hypothetical protein